MNVTVVGRLREIDRLRGILSGVNSRFLPKLVSVYGPPGIGKTFVVRRICENCKTQFEPSEQQLMELQLTPDDVKDKKFHYGRGCSKCNSTGYRGRIGIFEIMVFNDEIRDLIMKQASTSVLRSAGQKIGMRLLRDNGLAAIYDGITTIDEIAKETMMEEV